MQETGELIAAQNQEAQMPITDDWTPVCINAPGLVYSEILEAFPDFKGIDYNVFIKELNTEREEISVKIVGDVTENFGGIGNKALYIGDYNGSVAFVKVPAGRFQSKIPEMDKLLMAISKSTGIISYHGLTNTPNGLAYAYDWISTIDFNPIKLSFDRRINERQKRQFKAIEAITETLGVFFIGDAQALIGTDGKMHAIDVDNARPPIIDYENNRITISHKNFANRFKKAEV